jgi:hypothetical protein
MNRRVFDGPSIALCLLVALILTVIWKLSISPDGQRTNSVADLPVAPVADDARLQSILRDLGSTVQSATGSAQDGRIDVARMQPIKAELHRAITLIEEKEARERAGN